MQSRVRHRGRHRWSALVLLLALPLPVVAGTLRDDLGRPVSLERPPQRIVTVLPSLTEIVCALGECARLVGTDSYSNWPAAVLKLPKVGGLDDASIESIAALHPDLVLISRTERTVSRLDALGIKTFVIDTESFADVARDIDRVAALLGVPGKGAELNRTIASGVASAVATYAMAPGVKPPRVYFEVDSTPYAAGPGSFIGELLSKLGAGNIVTAELGPFPKLNPEYVVRQNPDLMMVLPSEVARLADRPGWSSIRAVREHRVCTFRPIDRDVISRPGPRLAEALQLIGDCLKRVAH